MRYMMFVSVDLSGEPFDPAPNNVEQWVSDNDASGQAPRHRWALRRDEGVDRGFDLLESGDLAEAVEIASKHPMARFERIAVQPVWTGD